MIEINEQNRNKNIRNTLFGQKTTDEKEGELNLKGNVLMIISQKKNKTKRVVPKTLNNQITTNIS